MLGTWNKRLEPVTSEERVSKVTREKWCWKGKKKAGKSDQPEVGGPTRSGKEN
jgi:hypothetical protein